MKRFLAKVLLSLTSALLCLVLLEGVTRVILSRDPDGDLVFSYVRLKPFHPPLEKARVFIDTYEKEKSSALMTYDPDLGWRPTARSSGGNIDGFASTRLDPDKAPRPGTLRIALFGGSYTRGGGDKSWWKVLEEQLQKRGIDAEVLNFGVGGFAMDQAFLRWKKDGAAYHPNVVIFGFSPGNIMDNVNILRLLQNRDTGIPFTKPRFLLDNGSLTLINSPTVPPEMLLPNIANLSHWPLLKYDFYYNPEDYRPRWWEASRLLAFAEARKDAATRIARERRFYQMDREPGQLALKIIQEFKGDVERTGARFLVIHLPAAPDLADYQAGGVFCYPELYRDIQESAPVIQTEQNLITVIGKANPRSFFLYSHYGDAINTSVGATAAEYIAAHCGKDALENK